MTDEELYHLLFNSITDALNTMEKMNFGEAKALLIAAQQQSEEGYLRRGVPPAPAGNFQEEPIERRQSLARIKG